MLLPPVGSEGTFVFSKPFSDYINSDQLLRVVSTRSIVELEDSSEQPFDTIYKAVGLSEKDFENDITNNALIVMFSTEGGEYIYVPTTYIESMPIRNGIKYHEVSLIINLGYIPLDFNIDLITDIIKDDN